MAEDLRRRLLVRLGAPLTASGERWDSGEWAESAAGYDVEDLASEVYKARDGAVESRTVPEPRGTS
jgi:hypothetical protein